MHRSPQQGSRHRETKRETPPQVWFSEVVGQTVTRVLAHRFSRHKRKEEAILVNWWVTKPEGKETGTLHDDTNAFGSTTHAAYSEDFRTHVVPEDRSTTCSCSASATPHSRPRFEDPFAVGRITRSQRPAASSESCHDSTLHSHCVDEKVGQSVLILIQFHFTLNFGGAYRDPRTC